LDDLVQHDVGILTNATISRVSDGEVQVAHDGHEETIGPFDDIVLALGYEPEASLAQELKGQVPAIYTIGDAVESRTAVEAIREGAEVARKI